MDLYNVYIYAKQFSAPDMVVFINRNTFSFEAYQLLPIYDPKSTHCVCVGTSYGLSMSHRLAAVEKIKLLRDYALMH